MKRIFAVVALLSLSAIFFAPPVLAGSCRCEPYTDAMGMQYGGESTCTAATNRNECGYNCTFSPNRCTDQCEAEGLKKTSRFCNTTSQCETGIGVAECCENVCFYDSRALQVWQAGTISGGKTVKFTKPILSVAIPGVIFSNTNDTLDEEGFISVPYLAQYLKGVYEFLVTAGSLLAVIVIILNGFRMTVSAGGEDKNKAIQNLGKALTGLFILWGSYALFYNINPDLVAFKPLKVQYITPYEYQEGGDSNQAVGEITPAEQVAPCPKSGGVNAIPDFVLGLRGKVAYRFGGKGGPPPYSETNAAYTQFNNNCPANNICLDCSGFINYVYMCTGVATISGGTATIFDGADKISPGSLDVEANTVGGQVLKPGDLLGWLAKDGKPGHVIMYIGNGQVAEAYGGFQGRQPGANPLIRPLRTVDLKTYNFTHVRRLTN